MNIYKFKTASTLRDYVRDSNKKKIKQKIKNIKNDIEKSAQDGEFSEKIIFNDKDIGNAIYEKITPELIYKGYEVSYCATTFADTPYLEITISWKHGGFGPYQIEKKMQEYYRTLGEIKRYADDVD